MLKRKKTFKNRKLLFDTNERSRKQNRAEDIEKMENRKKKINHGVLKID